ADLGETWQWGVSEFPVVSSVQKPAMLRLKEGPIMLCSFTDQWREWKDRAGLRFSGTGGEYTGFGLFAAVSLDEGKTWPHRRLLAPAGKPIADGYGYLAATQTRDGRIQLITSQNHYSFNLAWIRELPPTPGRPTPGN
ncbi:MAG: sialidase family protein, partial [Planctomycetota bacterium]